MLTGLKAVSEIIHSNAVSVGQGTAPLPVVRSETGARRMEIEKHHHFC